MKSLAVALQEFEKQYGISFDELPLDNQTKPPPVCAVCEDTGYYKLDLEWNHPLFGKMFRCDNPACPTVQHMIADQVERVMNYSSWEQSYSDWTFDTFRKIVTGNTWKDKRGAYAVAKSFAEFGQPFSLTDAAAYVWKKEWPDDDSGRKSNSVVLTGDVGRGKTSLAVAAVNMLRGRGQPVVFIRVHELIRRLQETYDRDWQGETTDTRMMFYSTVPYLVIDEFGVKDFTTNRLELIEAIIRERDRRSLPFLGTTNLSQSEFYSKWQPQIADIVAKAHWVPLGGLKLRETAAETTMW